MHSIGNLQFYYPAWLLFFSISLGIIYAIFLYYKDINFDETKPLYRYFLGFLRGLSIALLASLLLVPVLNKLSTKIETPIVVIAQDASKSMKTVENFDSSALSTAVSKLGQGLQDNYEVQYWSFGDSVSYADHSAITFNHNETNMSQLLENAKDQFKGRSVAGMILVTDGLYNVGMNPIYTSQQLGFPIVSVAMGDTTELVDIKIAQVLSNKVIYLDDMYEMQIDVAALGVEGEDFIGDDVPVIVSEVRGKNEKILLSKTVRISEKHFFETLTVRLKANVPGVMHLVVRVPQFANEKNIKNNRRDVYINVLDTRKKILIAANAPHPDIAAMKQILSRNDRYEVDLKYPFKEPINPQQYQLVILHNIPSENQSGTALMKSLQNAKIPQLYIVGPQCRSEELNNAQNVIIFPKSLEKNDIQGVFQPNFSLFELQDKTASQYSVYPPLYGKFGNFQLRPGAQALFLQKIGKITTQFPLVAFGEKSGVRQGVIAAEGIWKWKFYNYLDNQSHDKMSHLFFNIIQYLSVTESKEQFSAYVEKHIFEEDEHVNIFAELYNSAFQPITTEDIELTLTDQDGNTYDFRFSPLTTSYKLDLAYLKPGDYSFHAKANVDGSALHSYGKFTVEKSQKESINLVADHEILHSLAQNTGGMVFYPNQFNEIQPWLDNLESSKPVQYFSKRQVQLYDSIWLLAIILSLLIVEWSVRRLLGLY